jgi:cytochrome bd-type quinol oxidase subunit 1
MSEGAAFGFLFLVRLVLVAISVGVPVLLVGALVRWTTSRRGAAAGRVRRARLAGLGAVVGVVAGIAVWCALCRWRRVPLGPDTAAPA